MYVVVDAGETVVLPESPTLPIPPLIVTDVAPDTLQLNVDDPPGDMVPGFAAKESMLGKLTDGGVGAGDAAATTTRAVAVTVPASLTAVRV